MSSGITASLYVMKATAVAVFIYLSEIYFTSLLILSILFNEIISINM